MLRYINKQLPKEELHKAETHMLDCELCTDAYEGLALTQNSSMLFAIDNQIDKRVSGGVNKTPIMRNLMVAASLIAIVFGTYFTFNLFNETINNDGNLALNKTVQAKEKQTTENINNKGFLTGIELENDNKEVIPELISENVMSEGLVAEIEDDLVVEEMAESPIVANAEAFSLDEIEDVEMEEEIVVEAEVKLKDALEDPSVVTKMAMTESVVAERDESITEKRENKSLSKQRKKNSNSRAVSSAPAYADVLGSVVEERIVTPQNIRIIDGYKTVNYLEEYQKVYDSENEMAIDLSGISAGYANKFDKEVAEKAKEEATIEITYKETLEQGIQLYKNQKYRDALSEFDHILAKHPEEVNAQFYSGLCFYHLGQNASAIKKFNRVLKNKETEFNEEAIWYKALTLISMNDKTSAKKILKTISEDDGFYNVKAEERLKGL
ncbi:MAG: tetratricopeptide repeat protein [Vicingaceae bacterium]|nr:tetratricopeptide repeat protein [Vicingaceae bacterium]